MEPAPAADSPKPADSLWDRLMATAVPVRAGTGGVRLPPRPRRARRRILQGLVAAAALAAALVAHPGRGAAPAAAHSALAAGAPAAAVRSSPSASPAPVGALPPPLSTAAATTPTPVPTAAAPLPPDLGQPLPPLIQQRQGLLVDGIESVLESFLNN